jgi:hypothetical protein
MQYLNPAEGWDWFVRKTGRRALMWPAAALAERPDRIAVRPPRVQTLGGGLALSIFGAALLFAAHCAWANSRLDTLIFFTLGVLFLFGAWVAAAYRASASWDPYGRTLTLCRGVVPFVRTLELPRDRLRVVLSVGDDDGAMSNLKPGYTLLSLSHSERPGLVHLACVEDRSLLDGVLKRLDAFLGAPAEDRTYAAIVAEDGSTFEVDTAPFGRHAVSPRRMRLRFSSSQLAAFQSDWGGPILGFLLVSIGMAVLVALKLGIKLRVLMPLLAGLVVLALAAGAVIRASRRTIVADLAASRISLGRRGKEVSIKDVAAVQVCSFWRDYGDSKWTVCEVNLVLRRPRGERVNLLSDPDMEAARADAQRFANFLGVPLLDHTTSKPAA